MLLILLSFCLLLLGEASKLVQAQQQCRLLVANGSNIVSPTTTSNSGSTSGSQSPTKSTGSGPSTSASASATPSPTAFNYGKDIIRGVNLGGWFVLEPWITPSIFENFNNSNVVDEYTMGQLIDNGVALKILQNHWETWITEDDFVSIKAAGLNHVRMQIGYWSVPITSADTNYSTSVSPYIPGAWPYFIQALNWAKTHGIHVIVDLHGAPGSQNGYDNSGQRTGNPTWGTDNTSVPRTLDIIRYITEKVGGVIDILELLNEPTAFRDGMANVVRGYFQQGYQVVRQAGGNGLNVMIGDGFLGVQAWNGFLTGSSAQGVFMDFHEYQIFNYDQISLSLSDHIDYSCQVLQTLKSYASSNIFTIIGEWSLAMTDCALWLNGRGVGARWDGTWQSGQQTFGKCDNYTGNMDVFSEDYKTFLRKYYEAQISIGEAIQGWIFWTWKAENADEWSYQRGIEGGWIPQDPTDRVYPNLC